MWVRACRAGAAPVPSFAAASQAPGLSPGRWRSGSAGARVSQASGAAAPVVSGRAAKEGCLLKWEVSNRKRGLFFLRRYWVRKGKWGKHCNLEAYESPGQVLSCNFIRTLRPLLLFQYYFCFLPKGWIILLGLWLPINFACDQCFMLVKTSFFFPSGTVSLSLSTPLLQLPYLKHQFFFVMWCVAFLQKGRSKWISWDKTCFSYGWDEFPFT